MNHASAPKTNPSSPAPATHVSHSAAAPWQKSEGAISPPPRNRLIRLPQVEQLTGCKKSTLYELMAAGRFPRNFKINARLAVWSEAAVLEWVQSRVTEAEQQQ